MKTKILSLLLVTALLCCFVTSCKNGNDDTPQGMKKIGSEANTYSLYVPTTWEEKSSTSFTSAACPDKNNISLQVLSVRGVFSNGNEGYVIMTNTGTYEDINKYFEKEYYPYLESTFAEIELDTEETNATTQKFGDSTYTAKYVYNIKVDNVDYRIMQILSAHDSSIYIFTYTATKENFKTHQAEVELIVNNFKF